MLYLKRTLSGPLYLWFRFIVLISCKVDTWPFRNYDWFFSKESFGVLIAIFFFILFGFFFYLVMCFLWNGNVWGYTLFIHSHAVYIHEKVNPTRWYTHLQDWHFKISNQRYFLFCLFCFFLSFYLFVCLFVVFLCVFFFFGFRVFLVCFCFVLFYTSVHKVSLLVAKSSIILICINTNDTLRLK